MQRRLDWMLSVVLALVVGAGLASAASRAQVSKDDDAPLTRVLVDWILVPANNANAPSGTAGPVLVNRTASICETGTPVADRDCIDNELVSALRDRVKEPLRYAFVPPVVGSAFLERNAQPHEIADPGRPGLILVSPAVLRAAFGSAGNWDGFHARFPGAQGYVLLSAPGFDADRRHALVYVSYVHGNVGGIGMLVLLTRVDTSWQVTRSTQVWIS